MADIPQRSGRIEIWQVEDYRLTWSSPDVPTQAAHQFVRLVAAVTCIDKPGIFAAGHVNIGVQSCTWL
jgi:hypothetical protein